MGPYDEHHGYNAEEILGYAHGVMGVVGDIRVDNCLETIHRGCEETTVLCWVAVDSQRT
jgi:hypothetical protein